MKIFVGIGSNLIKVMVFTLNLVELAQNFYIQRTWSKVEN